MKKAVPVFLFAVLIAVFIGWAPNVHAYENFGSNGTNDNRQECHKIFGSGTNDPEHQAHAAAANNCNDCHGGFPPQLTNCTKCHGRTQDGGGDDISAGLGRGLRQHHQGAGITRCSECHGDTTGPAGVGENIPPSFYPGPANLNPCDGSEERFVSATQSLDNDGDGFTDGADSDCQATTPPQISVDPVSKNYGDVTLGSSSSQVFTVSNGGTDNLVITDGVLSDETNFILDATVGTTPCGDVPVTIEGGGSCTISIVFSPKTVDAFTAMVTVTSNSTTNSTLDIPLTGTGVAGTAPDIMVDPASFDYGSITVGDNTSHLFTVSNAGNDNPLAAPFSIQNDACSGQTLEPSPAPGSSCTLTVQFAPNATSPFSDSFDIPSNDPSTPTVTVTVDGTGTGVPVPDIEVTDSVAPNDDLEVPFGDVKEGESSEETVTVTNGGTADLVIGTVAFTDNLAAPFSIPAGMDTCSDTTLAPSESCTITVQFAPTALVASDDTFDIPSNDPDTPSVTVAVSGTGVPNIAPSAPALVLPADGASGLPTSVTFEWNRSTDADGDPVTYNLFVCANDNTFATCPDPVNTDPITASASGANDIAFAASGMGVMFFGVAFAAGIGRKKTVALLMAMALAAGVLVVACGDGGGGSSSPHGQVSFTETGLTTATTYYWKVVANDGMDSTDSATRSFTTQ